MSSGPHIPEGLVAGMKRLLIAADYERRMAAHPRLSQAAGLALLRAHGHLRESGWFRSFASRRPEDADGAPLPWFTYPAISFLSPRVRPDWRVFEYGCGHSTLWWAARVAEVVAVEHHPSWAERMRALSPSNADVRLRELAADDVARCPYADAPSDAGGRFQVIVIDGRRRVRCADRCLEALSEDGVIVWDNSERERYEPGLSALAGRGFRRVDFDGMGPINTYAWRTSVLYRDGNALGL